MATVLITIGSSLNIYTIGVVRLMATVLTTTGFPRAAVATANCSNTSKWFYPLKLPGVGNFKSPLITYTGER